MNPHFFKKHSPEDAASADVRFTELRVEPWPDGQRVRVHVDITPFQRNPNLSAAVTDGAGKEVAHAFIVETAEHRIVFTLHLRGASYPPYTLTAEISYPEIGPVDTRLTTFDIPPAPADTQPPAEV